MEVEQYQLQTKERQAEDFKTALWLSRVKKREHVIGG